MYTEGESLAGLAKKLRLDAIKNPLSHCCTTKNPSELPWAVFDNVDDVNPIITSQNWNTQ
jgi:hypothetical protein